MTSRRDCDRPGDGAVLLPSARPFGKRRACRGGRPHSRGSSSGSTGLRLGQVLPHPRCQSANTAAISPSSDATVLQAQIALSSWRVALAQSKLGSEASAGAVGNMKNNAAATLGYRVMFVPVIDRKSVV